MSPTNSGNKCRGLKPGLWMGVCVCVCGGVVESVCVHGECGDKGLLWSPLWSSERWSATPHSITNVSQEINLLQTLRHHV